MVQKKRDPMLDAIEREGLFGTDVSTVDTKKPFDQEKARSDAVMDGVRKVQAKALADLDALNQSFFAAAEKGDLQAVKDLFAKGASIDAASPNWVKGSTPLMCALANNHFDVARFLASRDADVNAKNETGQTPLTILATYVKEAHAKEGTDTAMFLIERGANVNKRGREDETALMCAARNNNKRMCELLIEKGAKLNSQDKDGVTALMFAAARSQLEICKQLIEKGARVGICENNGNNVISLISNIVPRNQDLVALLEKQLTKEIAEKAAKEKK